MERPQIGCILMAAGASARFGSDKLAAELGGRSLLRRACEAVPAARFRRVCIVTARAEGEALLETVSGFDRFEYCVSCLRLVNSPQAPFVLVIERNINKKLKDTGRGK